MHRLMAGSDRQTDRQTDRRTDGQTDRRVSGGAEAWMDRETDRYAMAVVAFSHVLLGLHTVGSSGSSTTVANSFSVFYIDS